MNFSFMRLRPFLIVCGLAIILSIPFLSQAPKNSALACWTNVLIECFDDPREGWPWAKPTGANPVRRWRVTPNPASQLAWGLQDRFYSVGLESYCGDDDEQSCWVIGGPGTEDPEFDNYPGNLTTFMTYGPINLATATEARVEFNLYFLNAMDIGDSITWGADSVFALAATHIWIDSTLTQATDLGWRHFSMDLKDLYRNIATRDSVSALGRTEVYVYWWFKSNSNTQRDRGAFVDDIIVSWDNGGLDTRAGGLAVVEPDSITIPTRIETGESVVFSYTWGTCDGGVANYPPFHVVMTLDEVVILDSLIEGALPGETHTWYTAPIEMTTEGNHTVQVFVDQNNEITETDEANNTATVPFTVYPPNVPPTFQWLSPGVLAPGGDTLFADTAGAMLRWNLFDPDNVAWLSLYFDTDTLGCLGPIVPGGLNLLEGDGPDSLHWDTGGLVNGSIRWPYAQYGDNLFSQCVYAPFPVKVDRATGSDKVVLIPVTFHLGQNYPNPFNPTTEIEFGIVRGGHTTLTVFDITGREVAKLIDNDLTPGIYQANFDAGVNRPSGVYIYRLDAPEGTITKKMILMK
jgi:hypothetical protein